jgi:hypothetical protein
MSRATTPLYEHLAAFVPLEIIEWKQQGGPQEWHFEEVQRRWKALAENQDAHSSIGYAGHEEGLTARTIAQLVECLGVMAFVPGGVKFGPLHFWANREEDMKEL